MVEYCCLKIPDLLRGVDNLKQQASDLFNDYFFSSRKSWQSSNCPSTTNVLEYVNFIINKLEQLLHSKADPLNALEPHIGKVYEQLVSMRKLLCDIAQHLGNLHMEFLLIRFKDAAYQADSLAMDSVNQILEEQRDMSNDQFNVTVVGMVRSRDHGGSGGALSICR
ncbi:hypothetical protein ACH5RR_002969 [Cinchona calisaya]|uniref:Uncharacterized protein n=1 Tax=Cinchona calisaya TaxID=153742 RepID=A0ABD3ATL4_9GENT